MRGAGLALLVLAGCAPPPGATFVGTWTGTVTRAWACGLSEQYQGAGDEPLTLAISALDPKTEVFAVDAWPVLCAGFTAALERQQGRDGHLDTVYLALAPGDCPAVADPLATRQESLTGGTLMVGPLGLTATWAETATVEDFQGVQSCRGLAYASGLARAP